MPIYDLSYRRIEGVRYAQNARFLPIIALGFRHYFKKKANLVLVLAGLIPWIIGMFVILLPTIFADSDVISGMSSKLVRLLHVSPDSANLAIATASYWFVVFIAIGAGAGAVANDVTSNALEIYFSRPITRFDYLLGKFGSIFALTSLVSLAPLLVVSLLDVAVCSEEGYLRSQVPVILRALAAQAVVLFAMSLLILAVSSLVKSQRNGTVVFIGFLIGLSVIAGIMREATNEPAFSLIDFQACLKRLVYDILGVAEYGNKMLAGPSEFLRGNFEVARQPLRNIETWKPVAVVLGWCAVALVVLHRRVRGFEVVKG